MPSALHHVTDWWKVATMALDGRSCISHRCLLPRIETNSKYIVPCTKIRWLHILTGPDGHRSCVALACASAVCSTHAVLTDGPRIDRA